MTKPDVTKQSYKVFQWASGTVGQHAARVALARDHLDLIGLYVYSPDKAGKDIGNLLGRDPTGIPATNNKSVVLESDADIVIHAPLASLVYGDHPEQDLDDICDLLAAGKNVITVVGYLYPSVHGDAVVARLRDACRQGNATFHSTGLNPGWMGDVIPLTMSTLAESIDLVHVLEISNFQYYPSPEIMFDAMGFNSTPAAFEVKNKRQGHWLNGLFSESVQMVADGMDLGVTGVTSQMEIALAENDLHTASGTVQAGNVAGQHWRWAGINSAGEEKVVHETVWRMHTDVAPDWARGKHSVHITGNPTMHVEFDESYVSDGLLATAMHAVNAIPHVVAADAGIKTLLDLPWLLTHNREAKNES